MPQFYYSNPALGVGISNLAEALIGNSARDVQMGLLGDRRRTAQAQRRKLEAEALSDEIKNREQQAAAAQLDSMVAAISGASGLQQPQSDALGQALRYTQRAGFGANPEQSSSGIANVLSAMLAMGNGDQMRQSLVVQGKQPTDKFAGTDARADSMIADALDAQLNRATTVAGMDNTAAMQRTQVQEAGRDARAAAAEAGRNTRQQARIQQTGEKNKAPLKVGAGDMKAINSAIAAAAAGAVGDTHADEVLVDPTAQNQLMQVIASLYQNSRNLPQAIDQGWAQVMGAQPEVETSGNWNPFATDRATVRPQRGANPTAALEEARKAIAAGADPEKVKQRLQQMGVDASGL